MAKKTTMDIIIRVRVIDEEKDSFTQAAEISGLSLSSWMRLRLREASIQDLQRANRPVPFLRAKK